MFRNLVIGILGVILVGTMGCNIKTPEIRGVVLDEETKQPVEEAWITATLEIRTKTLAGDVHKYLSVDPPHTRTGKDGKFIIPAKKLRKPTFPFGFGTEVTSFGIGASTIDDKGGSMSLKQFLGKDKAEVTIYMEPVERTESEYFSHLQALYNYCLTGRFFVEVPVVEGGCDEWELDYAITKHERYFEKYKEEVGKEVNTAFFDHWAYLYEKKGELNKAVETLRKSIDLIERRGLLRFEIWQKNKEEIESQINKLQETLHNSKK